MKERKKKQKFKKCTRPMTSSNSYLHLFKNPKSRFDFGSTMSGTVTGVGDGVVRPLIITDAFDDTSVSSVFCVRTEFLAVADDSRSTSMVVVLVTKLLRFIWSSVYCSANGCLFKRNDSDKNCKQSVERMCFGFTFRNEKKKMNIIFGRENSRAKNYKSVLSSPNPLHLQDNLTS